MASIELVKIKCVEPEDSNTDETYIVIRNNNQKSKVWGEKDMERGQARKLSGLGYLMQSDFRIYIYDYDPLGPDDQLASFKPSTTPGTHTKRLTRYDAIYELTYVIE